MNIIRKTGPITLIVSQSRVGTVLVDVSVGDAIRIVNRNCI